MKSSQEDSGLFTSRWEKLDPEPYTQDSSMINSDANREIDLVEAGEVSKPSILVTREEQRWGEVRWWGEGGMIGNLWDGWSWENNKHSLVIFPTHPSSNLPKTLLPLHFLPSNINFKAAGCRSSCEPLPNPCLPALIYCVNFNLT